VLPDAVAGQLSCFFSREIVPVQGGYGVRFCNHVRGLIEQDAHRGTRFLGGWKIIPVYKLCKRADAQSRYKYRGNYHGAKS
jgi:hypothetical protein